MLHMALQSLNVNRVMLWVKQKRQPPCYIYAEKQGQHFGTDGRNMRLMTGDTNVLYVPDIAAL
jgi:hypothetical protein